MVFPRDKLKSRQFFVMYFRASSRDATPSTFRLPRRFAPRNDTGAVGSSIKSAVSDLFRAPMCPVLPCFAAGHHACNFQIATAASRPRNDKAGGFYLKKERCFGLKTTAYDYKHSFFKQKRSKFMSLRGGRDFAPDAAIFNGTTRHPGTKYGKPK